MQFKNFKQQNNINHFLNLHKAMIIDAKTILKKKLEIYLTGSIIQGIRGAFNPLQ